MCKGLLRLGSRWLVGVGSHFSLLLPGIGGGGLLFVGVTVQLFSLGAVRRFPPTELPSPLPR